MGDVTESIKNGYTYKADGSREHQYKITRIESISSGAINIEKLGSSDNVNENYKLEDGDILFSHINSLPYIANTAIYTSNLGEIYHGMNLLNIRAKHEIIDSHFLLHLLKKESSRNWFRIIAKPAVNQASISTTEVSSFVFMMPNMEEQKRISSVLDNIDNLLTLHQRKCDEVKSLKKYMLQKMFPQNEQKVPEIRFEGFTEAWEQRKLGEYVSITSGEAPSKFEVGTELYVKVDDLNYNDKYVVDTQNKVAEHSTIKRVTKGSVIFPKRGAAIMTNKVRILGIDSYMDTNMMSLSSEKLDSEFLYNIISKEGLYKIADTSTIPQINNKHIEPYEVIIPSLDEQQLQQL